MMIKLNAYQIDELGSILSSTMSESMILTFSELSEHHNARIKIEFTEKDDSGIDKIQIYEIEEQS